MEIKPSDIEDLARGAAFLGSGGGGDPYIGGLLLQSAIEHGQAPQIISVDDIDDDAVVVPIAMMGAPTVMLEKLPNGAEPERALRRFEERLGKPATALVAAEIGGFNALLPLIAAARLGLPVIDGDGMGRAFPELQMVTFNIFGVPIAPMIMTDEHGNAVAVDCARSEDAERIARHVVMSMGGASHICLYSLNGRQAKESIVRDTLSLALGIGQSISGARDTSSDPVTSLISYLRSTDYYQHCGELFNGKIVDLLRETRQGFAVGRLVIESVNGKANRLEIEFQNENLIARIDGETKVVVPDLVCIVDRDTAEPITTEALRYGQRVRVIAVGAAPIMRSDVALDVFGPDKFGYDEPFTPVEKLNKFL
ncbi:MAG: DUF917 domain-containing protein [Arenicellales bacterium]|nr:DUF917 domain-containing protein [Arenicellales bacterium]